MSKPDMLRTVEDESGSDLQTTVEYDLAHQGWKIRLLTQAETTNGRPAWLSPAAARQLITHLNEQLAEASTRNLEEFGYAEGPQ